MYATTDDLKEQVSEKVLITLTDDEGNDPASLDEAGPAILGRIDAAITAATDEINGYCQARYPVPFSPVPGFIKKIAVDISIYNLFCRRGYNEDTADRAIIDRYRAAIKTMENIAKGLVTLGAPQPAPSSGVDISSGTRIFSRPNLEGF